MGTQSPNSEVAVTPPPQLIGSLRAGFDAVANHIGLILLPVLLDLFLWLGPKFNVKVLFDAFAAEMQTVAEMNSPQLLELWQSAQQSWTVLIERFNLATMLRTYPVGLPSLMAGAWPVDNPLGLPATITVTSFGSAFLWWMLFTVIGLVLASQYFNAVAIAAGGLKVREQAMPIWATLQVVLLTVVSALLIVLLVVPVMFILSILAFISSGIAQLATIILSVFVIWIFVPLLFSPHGIFLYRQNALRSMLTSMRLMRYVLPGTGMFFLSIVVLSEGLDLLWQVPPSSSWMSLVAIAGHAFINTALLASSFIYYRDAIIWVQEFLQRRVISQQNRVA